MPFARENCDSFTFERRKRKNGWRTRRKVLHRMNRTLIWLVLLARVPVCWCQEELTFDGAVDLDVKNNRRIHAPQLEVGKAEDAVAVARTYRLPTFRFNLLEVQPLTHIDFHFPAGSLGTFAATGPIPSADTTLGSPLRPATLFLAGADQPLSQLHRIGLGIKLQDLNRQLAQQKLPGRSRRSPTTLRRLILRSSRRKARLKPRKKRLSCSANWSAWQGRVSRSRQFCRGTCLKCKLG